MIGKLLQGGISGLLTGAGGLIGKVADAGNRRGLRKFGSKENREVREHELEMSQMKNYLAELKPVNSWIDTINRIPRPLMTFLVIAFLLIFCISPVTGISIAKSMSLIPDYLMMIIAGVFGFYFTFRTVDKMLDSKKKMSPDQYDEIKKTLEVKQEKTAEKLEKKADEQTEIMKTDIDGDGINDHALAQLKIFEGKKLKPYKCPAGFLSIGFGTNIEIGIDEIESEFLLVHRFKKVIFEVQKKLPWIKDIDIPRQNVLFDMGYNLGVAGLLKFENTLRLVQETNFSSAAKSMKKSRWYRQTGRRGRILVEQMKTGKFA